MLLGIAFGVVISGFLHELASLPLTQVPFIAAVPGVVGFLAGLKLGGSKSFKPSESDRILRILFVASIGSILVLVIFLLCTIPSRLINPSSDLPYEVAIAGIAGLVLVAQSHWQMALIFSLIAALSVAEYVAARSLVALLIATFFGLAAFAAFRRALRDDRQER